MSDFFFWFWLIFGCCIIACSMAWLTKALNILAKQLGVGNDYYFPLISVAQHIQTNADRIAALEAALNEAMKRDTFEKGWTTAHEPAKCGHARANWKDPQFGTTEYAGNERCEFCDAITAYRARIEALEAELAAAKTVNREVLSRENDELRALNDKLRDDVKRLMGPPERYWEQRWCYEQPRIAALEAALSKSVELQSHYAKLLNMHDGGERLTFNDAEEWMDRLRNLAKGGGDE